MLNEKNAEIQGFRLLDDRYSENGLFIEHLTYSYTISFARISCLCCVSHVPARGVHNDIG